MTVQDRPKTKVHTGSPRHPPVAVALSIRDIDQPHTTHF